MTIGPDPSHYGFRHFHLVLLLALFAVCTTMAQAQVTTLATFNGTDGANPRGDLTSSADGRTFYGTTQEGGDNGKGTVFSVPVGGGTPTTLASFNGANGDSPLASLLLSSDGSTLYGTTYGGGANGDGTIFSMPVGGGAVTTLASFTGANGQNPFGSLILNGNDLYGTTALGGANNEGSVFSVPVQGGAVTTLASFNGTNGMDPFGGLTLSAGILYGTTYGGGANTVGTVFSLPIGGGAVTTLATFDHYGGPRGSLTLIGNNLYGTAYIGAQVFSLPVGGGVLTDLANLTPNAQSPAQPFGSLTLSADGSTLFGTTSRAGANNFGTVFSIPVGGGSVTTLASFDGTTDGANPEGSLLLIGDTLYGTTESGPNGDGTVFSVAVPEPGGATLVLTGLLSVALYRRRPAR